MSIALRLWADDGPSSDEQAKLDAIGRDPRLAWRLREFCSEWFAPKYLKNCVGETTRNYFAAIRYWESITADWRLVDFLLASDDAGDDQCQDFTDELPDWGYSRRGVKRGDSIRIGRMSDCPAFTPLSSITAAEHASRIANLFRKAGPETSNRKKFAKILTRAPLVEIIPSDFDAKEPFDWPVARRIATACELMQRPWLPKWMPCELWWKVRLGLLFYTGLRLGTVTRLEAGHFGDKRGLPWLRVPGDIVKTGKAIELPLHPQLAELLADVARRRPAHETRLVPEGCNRRTFLDLHYDLQRLAELDEAQQQSPHGWRRTHLSEIFLLGAGRGLEAAQVAADHADGRTTAQNYVASVVNLFRLRLPPLF